MAITETIWCDFVIYTTTKDLLVERMAFDKCFWLDKLLPKLKDFYDKCVAPEIVSPIYLLGMQVHKYVHIHTHSYNILLII